MANDYFDLSIEGADQMGVAAQMMLDRLFVQYTYKQFEARLGRQRINWGISTIWNPNDIFNAYNFSDFDYEERPGSDAMLLKYYIGYAEYQLAVRYLKSRKKPLWPVCLNSTSGTTTFKYWPANFMKNWF
ncbi:MAG: hypothetical protein R2769_16025 [Saprospiraceae bacterium]